MTILHIASIDNDRFSGVPVIVPKLITAERRLSPDDRIALLNIRNKEIRSGDTGQINIMWTGRSTVKDLPKPFDAPDLAVFHEIYYPAFLRLANEFKKRNIPYIVVPHGGLTNEAQRKKRYKKVPANLLFFNKYIKRAGAIRFLSERERYSSKKAGNDNLLVFPYGIDLPDIRDHKRIKQEEGGRITYIGRFDIRVKGLDLLVKAAEQTADIMRKHKCVLNLYGPDASGGKKELLAMIHESKTEDIVIIHEPVNGEEKIKILADTDIFIQTSRTEGLPVTALEAMSMGVPCLVSRGTGLAELVNRYNAGWGETPKDDIKSLLVRALKDMDVAGNIHAEQGYNNIHEEYSGKDPLRCKGRNAIRLVSKEFSVTEKTKRVLEMYGRVSLTGRSR